MVGEYSGGKKEDWEMASLRKFHKLEQSVPKRLVPNASDRLVGRRNCRPPLNELLGCLLGLSSNTTGPGRSRKNNILDSCQKLPLQSDAIRFKECRVHLPKDDDQNV